MTTAADGERKRVLDVVSVLPSETAVYFLIYLIFVALAVAYAVGVSSVALFFSENHPVMGAVFVIGQLGFFTFVLAASLRRQQRPPVGAALTTRWQRSAKRIRFATLRIGLTRWLNRIARPSFEPYPDATKSTAFGRFFDATWRQLAEPGWPEPELWWAYQDGRPEARVAGTTARPIVAVAAGLMRRYPLEADLVRVYLFHEIGHLANRDLPLFTWTTALNAACQALIVSSAATSVIYASRFLSGDFLSALLLLVGIFWLLTLALTSLYVLRFAGVLISLRELQADIWAVSRLADFSHFERVVSDATRSRRGRRGSRLASLLGMRLRHLSGIERLDLLRRPRRLLSPRLRYFALTAVLLVFLQSNPFGEGVGRNAMRLPFLLAWAPLALAYFASAYRAVLGFAALGERLPVLTFLALSFGASTVLLLPLLKLPGLFGNALLAVGNTHAFWGVARDSFSVLKAEWSHPQYLLVPLVAIGWCWVATIWANRALRFRPLGLRQSVVAHYGRSVKFAVVGIAVQVLALGLILHDSDRESVFDALQAPFLPIRLFIPLLPFAFLLPPMVWRVDRGSHRA